MADDKQQATPGWVEKKQPDGSVRYYPDDQTNDQIRRSDNAAPAPQTSPSKPPTSTSKPADAPPTRADAAQTPLDAQEKPSAWQWLWKPKVDPKAASKFWATVMTAGESGGPKSPEQIDAQIQKGERGPSTKIMSDIAGDVTAGMTAPGQAALMALPGIGEYSFALRGGEKVAGLGKTLIPLLTKGPQYAASAYFGLQGLGALMGDKQDGESDTDFLERRILGGAAFLGTLHAAGGGIKDGMGKMLVSSFGLNEDMAGEVARRVEALEKVRAERDTSLDTIESERDSKLSSLDAATRRQVASLEHGLEQDQEALMEAHLGRSSNFDRMANDAIEQSKGKMSELQRSQLHEGSRIMSETIQAIREMEGDRDIEVGSLQKPFIEIGKAVKGPVTNAGAVRGIFDSTFKSRGIESSELPTAALRALGDADEGSGGMVYQGKTLDPGKPGDARLIATLKEQGAFKADDSGEVDFNKLTRVKEDVYSAARSAKDANVGGALMDVWGKLDEMQEKAAKAAGQEKEYAKAKGDYLKHKRGLGSGLMKDWLSAADVRDQDMTTKVSKLISSEDETSGGQVTRAIRTTLKAAGIDVGPLDDLQKQIDAEKDLPKRMGDTARALKGQSRGEVNSEGVRLKKGTKEAIDRARGVSKEAGQAIDEQADAEAKKIQEKYKSGEKAADRHPVIGGYDTEELAGKGNEELYRIKLGELARNYSGRVNIPAFAMTVYGIAHASAFPFIYGMAKGGIPEMVKNPAFQDWMIERSGVSPNSPQANRLRRAISQMGPMLRRIERTGVVQGAAMRGVTVRGEEDQPPSRDDDEPPTREKENLR